jgi:hypothetical protein
MLAAVLLTVMSFHNLFAGTVVGFLASAALVCTVVLPKAKAVQRRSVYERTTRGLRIFLATPRLRGLLALNLSVAAASALMIVNIVVLVQSGFGLAQSSTALAAFGGGSMLAAPTTAWRTLSIPWPMANTHRWKLSSRSPSTSDTPMDAKPARQKTQR